MLNVLYNTIGEFWFYLYISFYKCKVSCYLQYARETEQLNKMSRNEGRQKIFTLDPEMQVSPFCSVLLLERQSEILMKINLIYLPFSFQRLDFSGIEPDVKPFDERFGRRIMVSCHDLTFSLQGCVSEKNDGFSTNVSKLSSVHFIFLVSVRFLFCFAIRICSKFYSNVELSYMRMFIIPVSFIKAKTLI